tara:strand:+ start:62 stop:652 length:591 start_codon:yes stop_codon:yes gene_type:complete
MSDVQRFFQQVDTLFLIAKERPEANNDFMNRVERLQHNVVRRLPDEELFTFPEEIKLGQFLIGSREQIKKFWEEPGYAASFVGQDLHPEVYEKIQKLSSLEPDFLKNSWGNSNCTFDLSFPFFVAVVLTDGLVEKPDKFVIGLMAHAIARANYAWMEFKKGSVIDSVDVEAAKQEGTRLGFAEEMDLITSSDGGGC